jgi:hypothetical protein
MDHIQFKANQTAAAYVAHELDEHSQEAFEIHMMGCAECLNDVEAWRVIKQHMPDAVVVQAARQFKKNWWGGWGMAASFVGAMLVAGRFSARASIPAKRPFSRCSRSRGRTIARSLQWPRTRAPSCCA